MNTKSRPLPVRNWLDVGIAIAGINIVRQPQPEYHLGFRLCLMNRDQHSIRLVGRKWTLREQSGNTRIVEASNVFNQQPILTPGAVFSYGGCQTFATPPTEAEICFFGTDSQNRPFITPPFAFPRRAFSLPWKT